VRPLEDIFGAAAALDAAKSKVHRMILKSTIALARTGGDLVLVSPMLAGSSRGYSREVTERKPPKGDSYSCLGGFGKGVWRDVVAR
jgi:hypothetical protein